MTAAAKATRVLVLRAGSSAGNNLIRSLLTAGSSIYVLGCHDDPYVLKKSIAHENYALPIAAREQPLALERIIERAQVQLIVPTSDVDVLRLAQLRRRLSCRVFLPRKRLIERCQDKYVLTRLLRRHNVPAPLTYPLSSTDRLEEIFIRFRDSDRLWCRVRIGSGSFAALPVANASQARAWIAYWKEMRGVPASYFTLSEFLPGRDYCVQALWRNGKLILAKMAERLLYIDGGSPSGVSSTPALARTAFDLEVLDTCEQAIRSLDAHASGVFVLDLKENKSGTACVTEINAGRFATITSIHDLAGKWNMAVLYVRLAMGETVDDMPKYDFAPGYYLVRSVDTEPAVLSPADMSSSLTVGGNNLFRLLS